MFGWVLIREVTLVIGKKRIDKMMRNPGTEIFSRSRGSKTRHTKIKKFLGEEDFKATTLTEVFFLVLKKFSR